MSVDVLVPFRGGCEHREAAWEFLRTRYAERHTTWRLIAAPPPQGPWRKGLALSDALGFSRAEIVVQIDADVWTDGLPTAVAAVKAGAAWAMPHDQVFRLGEEATRAYMADEPWRHLPLAQPAYRGIPGGGAIVARREALVTAPVDPRFEGWGQEDEAQAFALRTLYGEPWRGGADLIHLWHPPQDRWTRKRGSAESWALRRRYGKAHNDPAAMAALIEESRDARQAGQHPLHDHPPV